MKYDSVIIVGPTASGKTKLSVELAKLLNSEVINADSQQLIKGLDIGTAKITAEEMGGIKHHLFNIIDVGEKYSVSQFRENSEIIVNNLKAQNKIPIIVGGTGLYVNSLIYNYTFGGSEEDTSKREYYFKLAEEKGVDFVHDILKKLDPKSASEIHANNLKRVVRAIEIAENSATKKSEQTLTKNPNLNPLIIGLNPSREVLFDRINKRVETMMANGLKNETDILNKKGFYNTNATLPIGYSEWGDYYHGEKTLDEVVEQIKLDTRHYAKRQFTWFKKLENVIWFNPENMPLNDILNSVMQMLE